MLNEKENWPFINQIEISSLPDWSDERDIIIVAIITIISTSPKPAYDRQGLD